MLLLVCVLIYLRMAIDECALGNGESVDKVSDTTTKQKESMMQSGHSIISGHDRLRFSHGQYCLACVLNMNGPVPNKGE